MVEPVDEHQDGIDPLLRDPAVNVESGNCLNVLKESFLTSAELDEMLHIGGKDGFRRYAGRSILDFPLKGLSIFALPPPHAALNPLLRVLVAFARRSMHAGEELALIQLNVNYLRNGSNEVKPHRHRCRQICASLGASRWLDVEGRQVLMTHGDCLPMAGELHSVPRDQASAGPRMSVCLFYGSVDEYEQGGIGVNAAHDGSVWWSHPQDQASCVKQTDLGNFTGKVKFISDRFNYGFIDCADLKERGYKSDVFVEKKLLASSAIGAEVLFSACLDKKGRPHVTAIRDISGGMLWSSSPNQSSSHARQEQEWQEES